MRHQVQLIAIALALGGCGEDGDLLYVRPSPVQPDNPAYGRLLTVFAASGDKESELAILVSGGVLRNAADFEKTGPICTDVPPDHVLVEQKIAVIPTDGEAELIAVLLDPSGADCEGRVRTQILVPIQRVGDETIPSVDASPADASNPDAALEVDAAP
jgi:hypothetical protein